MRGEISFPQNLSIIFIQKKKKNRTPPKHLPNPSPQTEKSRRLRQKGERSEDEVKHVTELQVSKMA